jgi:hypothetical protein
VTYVLDKPSSRRSTGHSTCLSDFRPLRTGRRTDTARLDSTFVILPLYTGSVIKRWRAWSSGAAPGPAVPARRRRCDDCPLCGVLRRGGGPAAWRSDEDPWCDWQGSTGEVRDRETRSRGPSTRRAQSAAPGIRDVPLRRQRVLGDCPWPTSLSTGATKASRTVPLGACLRLRKLRCPLKDRGPRAKRPGDEQPEPRLRRARSRARAHTGPEQPLRRQFGCHRNPASPPRSCGTNSLRRCTDRGTARYDVVH